MPIEIKSYKDNIASYALLVLYITPSIKFLFFSSVVNMIATSLLACSVFILRREIKVSNVKKILLIFWSLFFFQTFLSGLAADKSLELFHFFRYIVLFSNIALITLLVGVINFEKLLNCLGVWSVLICLMNWFGVIEASGSGELSYLILAMQAALGYFVWLSKLLFYDNGKLISLFFSILIFVTILSLAGRTSIISTCLITAILLSSFVLLNKKISLWGRIIAALLIPCSIFYFAPILLEHVFNDYFLYKMDLLLKGEGDGRFKVYYESIELIISNPFGVGLHGYEQYFGVYPHNIFLEVGLNSGVFAMLQLLVLAMLLIFIFIFDMKYLISKSWELVASGAVALFTIICWSTSNDFGSAYLPLSAMTVFIILYYDNRYKLL